MSRARDSGRVRSGGTGTTDAVYDTDEYGNAVTAPDPRYDWLGAKQRSADAPGGLVLMGVRLYNTSKDAVVPAPGQQGEGGGSW